MIPEKILGLEYSKHAIRERIFDEKGCIEQVPKDFYKAGCKSVVFQPEAKTLKVVYIYDDKNDLVLVIDPSTKKVITNYLKRNNNLNVWKGRFRIVFNANRKK